MNGGPAPNIASLSPRTVLEISGHTQGTPSRTVLELSETIWRAGPRVSGGRRAKPASTPQIPTDSLEQE